MINNSLDTYLFQVFEYNYNIVQSSPVRRDGEVDGLVDKPEQKTGSAEVNYEIIDYWLNDWFFDCLIDWLIDLSIIF